MMNRRPALIVIVTAVLVVFGSRNAAAQPPYGTVPKVALYGILSCHTIPNGPAGSYNTWVRPLVYDVLSKYSEQTVWVRAKYYLSTANTFRTLVFSSNWWEGRVTSLYTDTLWFERVWVGDGFGFTGYRSTPYPGFSRYPREGVSSGVNFPSRKGHLFTVDVEFYWYTPQGTWVSQTITATGGCWV